MSISDQQVEYAGPIERAVAACESDISGDVQGLAILRDHVLVGFLVLKKGDKAPPWVPPRAVVVSALRVDVRFQGQGIGTRALRSLPTWVEQAWPDIQRIVLSVDEENTGGIRSYLNAGWADLGIRIQGRIGWVRHMAIQLHSSHSELQY